MCGRKCTRTRARVCKRALYVCTLVCASGGGWAGSPFGGGAGPSQWLGKLVQTIFIKETRTYSNIIAQYAKEHVNKVWLRYGWGCSSTEAGARATLGPGLLKYRSRCASISSSHSIDLDTPGTEVGARCSLGLGLTALMS